MVTSYDTKCRVTRLVVHKVPEVKTGESDKTKVSTIAPNVANSSSEEDEGNSDKEQLEKEKSKKRKTVPSQPKSSVKGAKLVEELDVEDETPAKRKKKKIKKSN